MKGITKFSIALTVLLISGVNLKAGVIGDVSGDNKVGIEEAIHALQASRGTPMKICVSYLVDVCYGHPEGRP